MKLLRLKIIFLFISISFLSMFGQNGEFHTNLKQNCKYCHVSEGEATRNSAEIEKFKLSRQSYETYSSNTLDAFTTAPTGASKLCLSCHDGTLSSDHFYYKRLSDSQILGTNLKASHPISFRYDSYLAAKDGQLFDPNTTPSGLGGTISSDLLVDGQLECISCHDVHDIKKIKYYLVKPNFKSRLCLTCHNK